MNMLEKTIEANIKECMSKENVFRFRAPPVPRLSMPKNFYKEIWLWTKIDICAWMLSMYV
jgi:hypothetical protein